MDTRFFGVLAILLMLFPATLAQSCSAGTPDCCGNSVCDSAKGEDYGTCKTDCTTPKTIEVFIVSPENGAQFVRGDQVTVQARVNADSSKNAQVHQMIAVGKFGLLDMLDDGRHNDEKAGDHLYGNTFGVTEDYQQQQYHLAVQATVVQTTNSASIDYSVSPYLAASIGSTQERFALGDEIVLSGLITKKEKGFETDANLGISFENEKILHAVVTTDAQGRFDYNYQTSTIQPEGEWKITLTVRDENTNFGYYEKK
ncbi:MAG: hypothetical protein Q7R47_00200, partial [Candidatus Diapherotrites archaeon]|nr:hypothetical protein [Candidatus Diapherotrites archaeon]